MSERSRAPLRRPAITGRAGFSPRTNDTRDAEGPSEFPQPETRISIISNGVDEITTRVVRVASRLSIVADRIEGRDGDKAADETQAFSASASLTGLNHRLSSLSAAVKYLEEQAEQFDTL